MILSSLNYIQQRPVFHNMKKILCIVLLLLSSTTLFAQQDLQNYERGKKLLEYGNWQEAMEMLRPYMDSRQFGELSNYAHFHFARAAYGNGQYELAKGALETVLDERRWQHTDEARYLLILSKFNQEEYEGALDEIKNLKDNNLRKEAERATYRFLQNANLSWMIGNMKKYEDNEGFGLAVRAQLESKTVMSAEERRVYHEVKDLTGETTQQKDPRRSNQILEIAVVLPFNYGGGSGVSRLQSGNFIFEYYQGLKLAVEEARNNGANITMRTFDTERKPEVVEKILRDPFLQAADVIIGPIYPEETTLVAQFAEYHKIPQINPLSNLDDNIKDAEYSFLFRPSTSAISEGIMEYANRKSINKKIAIAYSSTSKDELLAKNLADDAKRKGFQVTSYQKIEGSNIRSFFSGLGVTKGGRSSVDMIVIFSDDPNVASPAFAVIESLNSRVPIIVPDSWLYFNFASFEMLEHQNIRFVGNNTINFQDENLEDFREGFFDKYKSFPGIYGHLGYETIYWINENLNRSKGFDFAKNIQSNGFQKGNITFGFDFRNSRSNQYVPILKLEEGALEIE